MNSFKNLNFGIKIILILVVIIVAGNGVIFTFVKHAIEQDNLEQVIDESRVMTSEALRAKDYVGELQSKGMFDPTLLKEAQEELQRSGAKSTAEIIKAARNTRYYKTIPVVAGWSIAQLDANSNESSHFKFRVTRIGARNPEREANPIERQMLEKMNKEGLKETWLKDPEINAIRFMQSVVMKKECMLCHGVEKDYPEGKGMDPLGIKMEGWQVGEQRGAFEVIADLGKAEGNVKAMVWHISWLSTVILLVTAGVVWVLVDRLAIRPVRSVRGVLDRVADGDLTVEIPSSTSRDDIGMTLESAARMTTSLRTMVQNLTEHVGQLKHFSGELSNVSRSMSQGSGELTDRSQQVSRAAGEVSQGMSTVSAAAEQAQANMSAISASAEQASANMTTISAAAEEASANLSAVAAATEQASVSMDHVQQAAERTSGNVASVAAAVEEMTASLDEVRRRCEAANYESQQARAHSKSNQEVMERLDVSAREIGQVVEVINNIADQTNMLALNAAIEAAGAGDAGKGFAVVSNEVKELARQTAEATRMIAKKVKEIQSSAEDVKQRTQQAGEIINRISQSNTEILHAVEEQNHTLTEVSHATSDVSQETEEVTRRVLESNQGIAEVTRNVTEISKGTEEVTRSVHEASQGIHLMARNVGDASRGNAEITGNVRQAAHHAQEVAQAMEGVRQAASSIAQLSGTVDGRAGEMARLAQELDRMVQQFKV